MLIGLRHSAVSSTCKLLQTARVPNLIRKRAPDRESFKDWLFAAQTDREFYGTSDQFRPTLQNPTNARGPGRRGGR